jgi:hypothetical protein
MEYIGRQFWSEVFRRRAADQMCEWNKQQCFGGKANSWTNPKSQFYQER